MDKNIKQQASQSAKYAYWLYSIKGCTDRVQKQLFRVCTCAEEIYKLTEKQLEALCKPANPKLKKEDVANIVESKKTWDLDRMWEQLVQAKLSFVSLEDTGYPSKLRNIANAPFALFYRGKLPEEKGMCVAIVGARMCSEYGRGMAKEIAQELAAHDVTVISGMARGIDAAGHRGALLSGGDTYAVLGSGVDVCYPNYHRQLYYEIIQQGGVLSEFLPGTKPESWNFPKRNRIISALSDIVLVIEAKKKSGSLITADFALEQGKDVYALPGRVTDELSAGCNRLIAQGAGPILSVEDLLKELSLLPLFSSKKASQRKDFSKTKKLPLEKDDMLVYGCLGLLPLNLEEILEKTGLDIQTASRILASLQRKGLVEEIYKNYYKII